MQVHRRLRRACTAVKEFATVRYAKLVAVGCCASDIELIIIKATAPDDAPLSERYVQELVKVLAFSPTSSRAFSLCFTRRFGNTGCWRVALKCLSLLHRLLRALPGGAASFHSDLRSARANSLLFLHPCRFRDRSSSASEDYTQFVQAYARLLDTALDCWFFELGADLENLIQSVSNFLGMLERVVESMPTGAAKHSFLVRWSMKQIIRDSILCYEKFRRDSICLLNSVFKMQEQSATSAMNVLKKAAMLRPQLGEFYDCCKSTMGLYGLYEYPIIDKVPSMEYIEALDSFLHGMWKLKDSSPSSDSLTPSLNFPADSPGDGRFNTQLANLQTSCIVTLKWEKFEEEEDKEDWLIRFDEEEPCWEVLLEEYARPCMDLLTSPWPCKFSTRSTFQEQGSKMWGIQALI